MNILLADDHAILRKGLILLLAEEFPLAHFGESSSTTETLQLLSEQPWDIVVLDIFMPGRSGLEVLAEVQRQYQDLPVLVLSSAPEEQLAVRVLKLGARGYLNKQAAPEELVAAVRKVLKGGRYVGAAMAEYLAQRINQTDHPQHEKLSDREYAVLRLLVAGMSIKEIADKLSLSAKTISTYHTRILKKLAVRNDIELIRYVLEHKLVL